MLLNLLINVIIVQLYTCYIEKSKCSFSHSIKMKIYFRRLVPCLPTAVPGLNWGDKYEKYDVSLYLNLLI